MSKNDTQTKPKWLSEDDLLELWLQHEPTAKSPYALYGNPPMWETLKDGDLTLFTRPGKTSQRPPGKPYAPYEEVDGVHYQWQRSGEWVGQGVQTTFGNFESAGPSKIDIPQHPKPEAKQQQPKPVKFAPPPNLDHALQAVYLWQGFASAGKLSEDETRHFGGEIGAVAWVTEFADLVDVAFRAAGDAGLEYPGVFAYEVTEELGRWLRQNTDASPLDVQRQLLARMTEGYEVDCTSLFPGLPAVEAPPPEVEEPAPVPRDTTGWTATAQEGDPASGPIWAVRDANKKWVLGVPRENHPDPDAAIAHAAATEHVVRASVARALCPPYPESPKRRQSSALDR